MSTKKWVPYGVSGHNLPRQPKINYTISDDALSVVELTLKESGIDTSIDIRLIGVSGHYAKFLQIAAKGYAVGEEFKEASKPSAIRSKLSTAIAMTGVDLNQDKKIIYKSIVDLAEFIFTFDMTATYLLIGKPINKQLTALIDSLNEDELNLRSIKVRLNKCNKILKEGLLLANEYPQKGSLIEYHKISFASDIALILIKLGFTPSSKKAQLFEELLLIILSDVHNYEFSSLHTLAETALLKRCSGFEEF